LSKEWNEQDRKELAKKAMDVVIASQQKKADVIIGMTEGNDLKVWYSSSSKYPLGDVIVRRDVNNPDVFWCPPGSVYNPVSGKCDPMYPDLAELKILDISHAADYDVQTNINSLFDGLVNTRFSVESPDKGVEKFVLQIDLGAEQDVAELGIATYKGGDRKYKLKVQLSNDPNNFNYTHEIETSGASDQMEFYKIAVDPIKARYVRIVGAGNSFNAWNSYTALKVRGRQVTDVTPTPKPKPDPGGPNDKHGIVKILPTDDTKPSWFLDDIEDPNKDPEFEIDGDSPFNKVAHPVLGHYYTVKSREGGLASGGTQLTLRLHVTPLTSKGNQKVTNDYHKMLKSQGYMISPQDIRDCEQTAIVRFRGITKEKGRMTHKKHGGKHTGKDDPRASCYALMLSFEEARDLLAELELDHPNYMFFKCAKQIAGLNMKSLENQWIGTKSIGFVEGDEIHETLMVNTNPIKPDGTINNANWTPYVEFVWAVGVKDSDGKPITMTPTWGGMITTWRINEVKEVDVYKLSVRSILAK
jgi:hypothetical protein